MNRESEEQIITWARTHVKEPWINFVEISAKINNGESLPYPRRIVNIPMSPFKADMAALYPLMRHLTGMLTFEPGNLFTIILNDKGDKILKAYLEETENNNYVAMIDIPLEKSWVGQAEKIIAAGELEGLRELLDALTHDKFNKRVNWVKISNLGFFRCFKDVMDRYYKTRSLVEYTSGAINAVLEIYRNDWIKFTPMPPVFQRTEELMKNILDIDMDHLQRILKSIVYKPDNLTTIPWIVLIYAEEFKIALKNSGKDPMVLTLNQDDLYNLEAERPIELAKEMARQTGAGFTLAIRFEALRNIIYESTIRPLPHKDDDAQLVVSKVLSFIRDYGVSWAAYPVPVPLKQYIRIPVKLLGLPYDINNLASEFLAKIAVKGLPLVVGSDATFAYVLLDKEKVQAVIISDLRRGGVPRVKTLPPEEFDEYFKGLKSDPNDLAERLEHVKYVLWDKVGWITFAYGIQMDLIRKLPQILDIKAISSAPRLPGLWWKMKGVKRILAEGGFAVYPNLQFKRVAEWAEKQGKLSIYQAVFQGLFERKRPKTRGLLYIRETIIAAIALIVFIILLILIL